MGSFYVLVTVIVACAAWAFHNRESALIPRLASRYGLRAGARRLSGRGLEVVLTTEGSGKSQTTYVNYTMLVPGFPRSLTLLREGADTALRHSQGRCELTTGDLDFDDLVWIESDDPTEALNYLTPTRRHVFVELLFRLRNSSVTDGRIRGKVAWGPGVMESVVKNCLYTADHVDQPTVTLPRRPPGWVHRYQRRYHAGYALGLGITLLFPGLTLVYFGDAGSPTTPLGGLAIAGAIPLLWSSLVLLLGLQQSSRTLRQSLRLVQGIGLVGIAAIVHIWCSAAQNYSGWVGIPAGGFLAGAAWWFTLETWRTSLQRVRWS